MRSRRLLVPVLLLVLATGVSAAGDERYSSLLSGPPCKPFEKGADASPYWARQRHMTVLVDSVLLSGARALRYAKPCWRVHMRGRPALMLPIANRELRRDRPKVARLAVIGLGYNSLWQRNRRNYRKWARRFDRDANALLRTLSDLGAKHFVWVTLREPTPKTVPRSSVRDLGMYSWYFPYVNERLRRLDRLREDLVLADWAEASRRPGLTYDTIHLNDTGAKLMARTIRAAIYAEAKRLRAR